MKRTFDHIRDGMMLRLEIDTPRRVPALSKLLDSEWCMEFEGLMRRRLIFGAFRYGTFAEHEAKGSNEYNNVQSAIDRLKLYKLTGNMDHLVDASKRGMISSILRS